MIGLVSHKDSSFFRVVTDPPQPGEAVRQEDVLGLTITEEAEKITTGSITLLDRNGMYSKILRRNTPIIVAWGYRRAGIDPASTLSSGLESFGKLLDRRGMRAIIQSPAGNAPENGQMTYKASFLCRDYRGLDETQPFPPMAKKRVIDLVMAKCGVAAPDVRFAGDTDVVEERQDETAFRYLARKSQEWHAVFRIGYDASGVLQGVFLSPDHLEDSPIAKVLTGGGLVLRWGTGATSNVLNYDWQNSEGENGQGDNVRLELVNGQYQYQHVTVDAEKVTVWKLDMNRVQAEFDARKDDFSSEQAFVRSVMDARSFEDVKYLFRADVQVTAPNGFGYVVRARMFGTPFATPPAVVGFGEGFPAMLTTLNPDGSKIAGKPNVFYLRRVMHDLSASGWFCDTEIVDAYLMYGAVGLQ